MPRQQRCGGHGEYRAPPVAGDQPGQRREPQPVRGLIADLWVPRTSSTSSNQAVFADQATDASLPSDAVLPPHAGTAAATRLVA